MKEGVGRALRRVIGRDDVLSRIKPRTGGVSILMNGKRRKIYQYLVENPLSHLRELARETGIPVGTVDWHVKILTKAGIISTFEDKNKRYLYPTGWIATEDLDGLSALQDRTSREIYFTVKKNKGLSQTNIAERMGKYQQYVQPHLANLERYGFLAPNSEGRRKVYRIGGKASELQKKYEERVVDYLKGVMDMLKDDGLNPKIQGRSKVVMKVRMDDGQNVFHLRIRANPIKTILRE
jgi:DNA-binding transcriptional ArsR family regulator